MAKIDKNLIEQFRKLAENYMSCGNNWADKQPKSVDMVESGAQAWQLAHRAGITELCYGNTSKDIEGIDGITDAHIKTALAQVFPNAIFKDNYRY